MVKIRVMKIAGVRYDSRDFTPLKFRQQDTS